MQDSRLIILAFISSVLFSSGAFAFDIATFSIRGLTLNQTKDVVDNLLTADYGDETSMHSMNGSRLVNAIPYKCKVSSSGRSQCQSQFQEHEPGEELTKMLRYESIRVNFNEAGILFGVDYTTHVQVAEDFESCMQELNDITSSIKAKHPAPKFDDPLQHNIENRRMKEGVEMMWLDGETRKNMEKYSIKIGCTEEGMMGIESSMMSGKIQHAAQADKTTGAARY